MSRSIGAEKPCLVATCEDHLCLQTAQEVNLLTDESGRSPERNVTGWVSIDACVSSHAGSVEYGKVVFWRTSGIQWSVGGLAQSVSYWWVG